MSAGNAAGNTAGTSAGGAAAGAAVGGAGTKQQSSREPLLRGFDTTLRGAGGWTPAHAKLNEHPFMITPRTFRVPVLGVSVKLSLMEVRCACAASRVGGRSDSTQRADRGCLTTTFCIFAVCVISGASTVKRRCVERRQTIGGSDTDGAKRDVISSVGK